VTNGSERGDRHESDPRNTPSKRARWRNGLTAPIASSSAAAGCRVQRRSDIGDREWSSDSRSRHLEPGQAWSESTNAARTATRWSSTSARMVSRPGRSASRHEPAAQAEHPSTRCRRWESRLGQPRSARIEVVDPRQHRSHRAGDRTVSRPGGVRERRACRLGAACARPDGERPAAPVGSGSRTGPQRLAPPTGFEPVSPP
jgi:hypothetical protein